MAAETRPQVGPSDALLVVDAAESLGPADEHTVVQVLGNGIEAHCSVATAVYAFLRHHESFQDAILFALSLGGDADTITSLSR